MLVYRIGKLKHSKDLSGEGARLNGGRWNHKLIPCIYTSESRSLALLEYSVNVNLENIPRALTITSIEIPTQSILTITEKQLPGNWRSIPIATSTKDYGTKLLQSNSYAVIKIPSAIMPSEFNYILNPLHFLHKSFKIKNVQDLLYDIRIKLT